MTQRARIDPRTKPQRTQAERVLWAALRRRQLGGFSWRRSHAFGGHLLDFYCPALGVAIELDTPDDTLHLRRSRLLARLGILLMRVSDDDVHRLLDAILARLARHGATSTPHPRLTGI